jgi:hypothetical protein
MVIKKMRTLPRVETATIYLALQARRDNIYRGCRGECPFLLGYQSQPGGAGF